MDSKYKFTIQTSNNGQLIIPLFEGKAVSGVVNNLKPHKQRLCSRICEKRVRNQVMALLPKHQDIAQKDEFEVKVNIKEIRDREELFFDKSINEYNLNLLLARYPIRETPVLDGITRFC